MPKHILIVGIITEAVEVNNTATSRKKDTSHLEKDNFLYIDILDYYTNLLKVFFKIPGVHTDKKGVDLIYESSIDNTKKLIDIKTQSNIKKSLNLYLREFNVEKLRDRNYIIFNKKNKKLFGKIYFINSQLIDSLFNDKVFTKLLEDIKIFENLTQKYIEAESNLHKEFIALKKEFNNKNITLDETKIKIVFLTPRKDKNGILGNTNFKENIKLEISC